MEVMLDLETLGTTPGSAILSIGAAGFDLHKGYQQRAFHLLVDLQPQFDAGMTVSETSLVAGSPPKRFLRCSTASAGVIIARPPTRPCSSPCGL